MPNWCNNTLTINGSNKDVRKFIANGLHKKSVPNDAAQIEGLISENDSEDSCLRLTSYVPMPKTFKNYDTTNYPEKFKKQAKYQMKNYGCVGWYDWGLKYLGTKWDTELTSPKVTRWENDEISITFNFDTAWAPPVTWLENVQKKYPKLIFYMEFIEEGMDFRGFSETIVRNGESPYIDTNFEEVGENDTEIGIW